MQEGGLFFAGGRRLYGTLSTASIHGQVRDGLCVGGGLQTPRHIVDSVDPWLAPHRSHFQVAASSASLNPSPLWHIVDSVNSRRRRRATRGAEASEHATPSHPRTPFTPWKAESGGECGGL
jgi:hypothetical protein